MKTERKGVTLWQVDASHIKHYTHNPFPKFGEGSTKYIPMVNEFLLEMPSERGVGNQGIFAVHSPDYLALFHFRGSRVRLSKDSPCLEFLSESIWERERNPQIDFLWGSNLSVDKIANKITDSLSMPFMLWV